MSEVHRVALVSDIHGNAIALREVLRSIALQGADQIVCLGDVATLGVAPEEVIDMLQRLGCVCIRGNHDDYLIDASIVDSHSELPILVDAIDWCRDRLPAGQIEFLRSFQDDLDIDFGSHRLKLFHGCPSSNTVDLLADTPADVFDGLLGPQRSTVMAGGHTHLQMLRQHGGTLVVNPGSVGAPFREFPNGKPPVILDHAEYAIVELGAAEVGVSLHRVALDRELLATVARDSTNPMKAQLAAPYL